MERGILLPCGGGKAKGAMHSHFTPTCACIPARSPFRAAVCRSAMNAPDLANCWAKCPLELAHRFTPNLPHFVSPRSRSCMCVPAGAYTFGIRVWSNPRLCTSYAFLQIIIGQVDIAWQARIYGIRL